MIKTATPVVLLTLGLVAAPVAGDHDRKEHRVVIHDHRGVHTVHVEWDEDEFEEEMERFGERMARFGERMGRIGERIGRDVERAMEDVDWGAIERHHRHHDQEIHVHADHLGDVIASSVELSLGAVFEALRALDHVDFSVRFDEEAFEREMDRLERNLERLDEQMERDLEDAMDELERQMELLEKELERHEI